MSDTLIVAHTSDLHLGAHARADRELSRLRAVIGASEEAGARVLILAGDTFDSHRASAAVAEGASQLLSAAAMQVVILPGNHDPATPDAVFRRGGFADPENIHVFGVTLDGVARFADLDLEVSGAAHASYADYAPLAHVHARALRWHIVVAHGHWVTGPHDAHRGWLIHDAEIAACDADYVALGHWDLAQPAGGGTVPAYYSGSPDLARTVNIVRFDSAGVEVQRHPLDLGG